MDTILEAETPEGIRLQLHPAGPLARALALLVDQVILWVGLGLAAIPLAFAGPAGIGVWMILLFLGQWLYPVIFEVSVRGATLGKRILGLRVLMVDGTPVRLGPSLLRNLLRVVDVLPLSYTVGLIATLSTRHFQRVGDLVAGTLVVHETRPSMLWLPEGPAEAPPVPLTLEEQVALVAFGERASGLPLGRPGELADLLEPLTGRREHEGAEALLAMARHLKGQA